MSHASHIDGATNELKTTSGSSPSAPTWLRRARIITAAVYVLLETAYCIFIVVCIVRYPRCEQAPATPWWLNGVFLRLSTRETTFNNVTERLNDYRNNFNIQALWLSPVVPLSAELNPLAWTGVDRNLGDEDTLAKMITRAHESNIRVIVDYPLNHLSIRSAQFNTDVDSYFVWNDHGNASNWKTIDNDQRSAWTYDDRKKSFYLHQFDTNGDAVDVNFRNNRVFSDLMDGFAFWEKRFSFDGYNLQGVSYAYEDYDYRNETRAEKRTRHLDEDYLLLAHIRAQIGESKVLLLDAIDSIVTSDASLLRRYYGQNNRALGGVQLSSIKEFILTDAAATNITALFDSYHSSLFFKEGQPLIWSSLSSNPKVNEAFFVACLFQPGVVSIVPDQPGQQLSSQQLSRLRQMLTLAQSLDVFRVGRVRANILPKSRLLTIERARRGSPHHMIIVNFNTVEQEEMIALNEGLINTVEVLLTNMANPSARYEINALIDMNESIRLAPYEYLVVRWSPSIDRLGSIF